MLAKAKRYKSGTNDEATNVGDYSTTRCVIILQIIEGFDNEKLLKAIKEFTSLEWWEVFMKIPHERRMTSLDRL